jgi:phospholipid/cholesterol/gamma-HCH transport system substrate-binding protein
MSREIKIGLLTFVVLVTMIWGYTFLKGRNLLSASNELFTTYEDVANLNVSSPVLVNGFKIGTVTKIRLNPKDVKKMDVYYLVNSDYKIPKNAIAKLKSLGFVDGKGISLEFEKECTGADCAVNGDELKGGSLGMLGSMLGEGEVSAYSAELSATVKKIISDIGKEGETGSINETFRHLEAISKNLEEITAASEKVINQSSSGLQKTISNLAAISTTLANSNRQIETMIANMEKISGDVASSNLGNTISKTNTSLDELTQTLKAARNTMDDVNNVIQKIEKGQGTMAKLINERELYENIEASTRNLNLLLQDVRLNPKRYAHFSIFGKKQQAYTLSTEDPSKDKKQ